MFDVRFLTNPHYVPELKHLDGRDPRVAAYVHQDPLTQPFQAHMTDLITFCLPAYEREGKAYLNIAIGCTGGQHRSVVLAEELAVTLRKAGYAIALLHRDAVANRAAGAREQARQSRSTPVPALPPPAPARASTETEAS